MNSITPSCHSPQCFEATEFLFGNMAQNWRGLNPCHERWAYSCGGFNATYHDKIPPHRGRIGVMSNQQDEVDDILRGFLNKPYDAVVESVAGPVPLDSEPDDAANLKLVSDYYRTCMESDAGDEAFLDLMEEVNKAFAPMDDMLVIEGNRNISVYTPKTDTSLGLCWGDEMMLGNAQANLALLDIFPFAKIAVQRSLLHAGKTAIVITPHREPQNSRKILYKNHKEGLELYEKQMALIVEQAHRRLAPRIQAKVEDIAQEMRRFEETLEAEVYIDPRRKMKLVKGETAEYSMDELHKLAPMLGLSTTVPALLRSRNTPFNATADKVELAFPGYFRQLDWALRGPSKETIRSWMLFQTYLQTREVWRMPWTQEWTRFSHDYFGVLSNMTLEEKCLSRAKRHFGHVLDSFYIRQEFLRNESDSTALVGRMAEMIREQWRQMAITTEWTSASASNATMMRLNHLTVSIGYPQTTPDVRDPSSVARFYDGAVVRAGGDTRDLEGGIFLHRPGRWTHAHDYFALERRRLNREWSRFGGEPRGTDEWPVNAHALEPHYSAPTNHLVVPAGLLRMPLFSPALPAWYAYAVVGTAIGRSMMSAIDGIGQQYQLDGTVVGDSWMAGDWETYDSLLRCFFRRWYRRHSANIGYTFELTVDNMWEEIIADHEGMEAAYRAWRASHGRDGGGGGGSGQLSLPGMELFSHHEQYWLARTAPLCDLAPWPVEGGDLMYGDRPPGAARAVEPLWDFPPFHASQGCGCARCYMRRCRIFGQDLPHDASLNTAGLRDMGRGRERQRRIGPTTLAGRLAVKSRFWTPLDLNMYEPAFVGPEC